MKKYYGECSENHEYINICTMEEFELNNMEEDCYSYWTNSEEEIYSELQPFIDVADEYRNR